MSFDPEYAEVPDQVSEEDAYRPLPSIHDAFEEREWDLRVRMFALDMSVQAASTIISATDNDEVKRSKLRRCAEDFEAYLKGEPLPVR